MLKLFLNNFSQRRKFCEGGWRFLGIVRNNFFQNRMFKVSELWVCRVQTCAETSLYYDMQNQHWMIILIVYLTSYHKLWTSSNCVVYSLEGRTFWRPRWAIHGMWCPHVHQKYWDTVWKWSKTTYLGSQGWTGIQWLQSYNSIWWRCESSKWWKRQGLPSDFSLCKNWNFDLKCEFVSWCVYTLIGVTLYTFAVFPWTIWVLNASWRILWSHTFSKSIWGFCSSTNSSNVSYQPQKGSWAIWWGKGTEFHPFPNFCWQNCWVFGNYRLCCWSTRSFHESWPLDLWSRSIFRFFWELVALMMTLVS